MFSNALEELKTAVDIEPNRLDIYQKLGMIYEKLGQSGLAAESFAKAKALSGNP
jgi:Tfp pilus assembly protein PilF